MNGFGEALPAPYALWFVLGPSESLSEGQRCCPRRGRMTIHRWGGEACALKEKQERMAIQKHSHEIHHLGGEACTSGSGEAMPAPKNLPAG